MKRNTHGIAAEVVPATLVFALALVSPARAAEPALPPIRPQATNWYSAQFPKRPPLPLNPFGGTVPVYALDERHYIYDDRSVDYEKLRREASTVAAAPESGPPMTAQSGLRLLDLSWQGSNVTITVAGANGCPAYDLLRATNLVGNTLVSANWSWVSRVTNSQTITLSNQPWPLAWYMLATTCDTNGNGLTDVQDDELSRNVLVNDVTEDYTNAQNTQSETAVLAFGDTVMAAWVDSNLGVPGFGKTDCSCDPPFFPAAVPQFIGWAVSRDGGATFKDRGALPVVSNIFFIITNCDDYSPQGYFQTNMLGNAADPALARDGSNGLIYVVGNPQRPSSIYPDGTSQPPKLYVPLWRSTNNGESFLPPINVAIGLTNVEVRDFCDGPTIAVDNSAGTGQGDVFVAFKLVDSVQRLALCRSTNHGDDFRVIRFVPPPVAGGGGLHDQQP